MLIKVSSALVKALQSLGPARMFWAHFLILLLGLDSFTLALRSLLGLILLAKPGSILAALLFLLGLA